jgi:hypothetical protein
LLKLFFFIFLCCVLHHTQLRDEAKNFIKYSVVRGKFIHLWVYRWHIPDFVLYDKYGFRDVAGSILNDKLDKCVKRW